MAKRVLQKQQQGEIIIYESPKKGASIDVRLENETVWLSQKQMAQLFGVNVRTVNEHLGNTFKSKGLQKRSVIRKFRITGSGGKTYETRFMSL